MNRTRATRESVFVSLSSTGQVIITSAEANRRVAEDVGPQDIKSEALDTGEVDTAGRLSLPAEIRSYLRRT